MRNHTRLERLERSATQPGRRRIFITSDDWLRLQPPIYLDCTDAGDIPLSVFVGNNPDCLPDDVLARVVNACAITLARDAGDDCTIIRYGAWPPNAQEAI